MLPRPSISPDLNPFEKLWQQLKVKIKNRDPKSLQELKLVDIEEWSAIAPETTSNLIKNYRKRLLSVIKMKGHATDF